MLEHTDILGLKAQKFKQNVYLIYNVISDSGSLCQKLAVYANGRMSLSMHSVLFF